MADLVIHEGTSALPLFSFKSSTIQLLASSSLSRKAFLTVFFKGCDAAETYSHAS